MIARFMIKVIVPVSNRKFEVCLNFRTFQPKFSLVIILSVEDQLIELASVSIKSDKSISNYSFLIMNTIFYNNKSKNQINFHFLKRRKIFM